MCNLQYLYDSGSNIRSYISVSFFGLLIVGFVVFEGATYAGDPEFVKLVKPSTALTVLAANIIGPSLSADGRYSASELADSNELVIKQQSDGKELYRFAISGMEFARLKPTFSQNSEFILTHSMPTNSNEGTDGIQNRLIVHQCSTGKKLFETNLSLYPTAIAFSDDWIIVAGESRRNGSKYICQIFRSDNGSEVGALIIPVDSGLASEFVDFREIVLDDTHLHVHSINHFASFLGGSSPETHVTYSWNWKRVLELSEQGENVIAVGKQLELVYKRNNQSTHPRDDLTRLGATVGPYLTRVNQASDRNSATYIQFDENTGEAQLYAEDPEGGLSINLSGMLLSDREILHLLKKIPSVKEIVFSHFQLNDLSQLSQINGLEHLVTRRTLSTTDFMGIANLDSLKRLPSRVENDDALTYVGKMNSLESLTLASKDVTDTGINRILQMRSLKAVYLLETGVSARGLKQLEELPTLDEVIIDFGLDASDQALRLLVGSQKIKKLVLGIWNRAPSKISDAGLIFVADIANLEDLDLNFIPVTDVGVEHLLELKKLKTLNLMGTSISNRSLLSLSRLPLLSTLDVTSCEKLTDDGLLQLQNIKTLRTLRLSYAGSSISKEGVSELRRLRPDLNIWTGTEF